MTASASQELPLEQITTLVEEIERLPDPVARERSRALVQAVLDLHRAGLARLLERAAARPDGAALVDDLAGDETVALLLSLHRLHPHDLATRVAAAVDELRPRLQPDGVSIELAAVSEDAARVRLTAVGKVRTPAAVLRATVEAAIGRRAPEIASVEISGLDATDVVAINLGPRRS